MIAIIGNKGAGKSALADSLALAANAHCLHYEFLNDRRFRRPPNRSSHFTADITWGDGSVGSRGLHQGYDSGAPERVKYLPQSYMEELCNELQGDRESQFEREIRKVVFQHIPTEEKLGAPDLDALISQKLQPIRTTLVELRNELATINSEICVLEAMCRPESLTRLEQELVLRIAELDTHERAKPEIPVVAHDTAGSKLIERIQILEDTRRELQIKSGKFRSRLAQIAKQRQAEINVRAILQALGEHVGKQVDQARRTLHDVGLRLDIDEIVKLSILPSPLDAMRDTLHQEFDVVRGMLEGTNTEGLLARSAAVEDELRSLREQLEGPSRLAQTHAEELRRWADLKKSIIGEDGISGSIRDLEVQIARMKGDYPAQLASLSERRISLSCRIYKTISDHADILSGLFGYVDASLIARFDIEFLVFISCRRLEGQFFGHIGHQRGAFAGVEEGKERLAEIVRGHECTEWGGVRHIIEDISQALAMDFRGVVRRIDEQLRRGATSESFYNFLYGLEYLEPVLTLRLGGRDLSALSPGERGALLLVFYLLVDQSRCPIIIDQPEQNLDNESVFKVLVPCFKTARDLRQVIVVTHNPNLAVVCDAEQIIHCSIEKGNGFKFNYRAGSIEDPELNKHLVDVLEGTWPAFRMRDHKYQGDQTKVGESDVGDVSER